MENLQTYKLLHENGSFIFLTETQFLKAATANYYSTVFYASSVWYMNIKSMYKTKFNPLHFRILRIATKLHDESRTVLTARCQRATTIEWVRYITSTRVINKTVLDDEPKPFLTFYS